MAMRNACCGLFLLSMIAPPERGLEIGASAGGGKYRDVSCTGPTYYYREQTYAANVRYRADNGVTVAASASESLGEPAGAGPRRDGFDVAGRVGWHSPYGGLEVGAAAHRRDEKTEAVPSALAWVGLPELHAFGTVLADRYAINQGDFKLGVGGQYKWAAVEVGVGIQGFAADLEVRAFPWVSPTFSVRSNKDENWNLAGGLVFRWDPQLGSPPR